mgnify:CR=1 FL=1
MGLHLPLRLRAHPAAGHRRIGFGKDFTIYDTDDSKRVIRDILKEMNLDEKAFQPRSVLSVISASKDRYESPEDFAKPIPMRPTGR